MQHPRSIFGSGRAHQAPVVGGGGWMLGFVRQPNLRSLRPVRQPIPLLPHCFAGIWTYPRCHLSSPLPPPSPDPRAHAIILRQRPLARGHGAYRTLEPPLGCHVRLIVGVALVAAGSPGSGIGREETVEKFAPSSNPGDLDVLYRRRFRSAAFCDFWYGGNQQT